jgi:predicted DNA-binding helix-hairpin-helix protein
LTSLDKKRNSLGVYNAIMPGGKKISLLKTMLTSACERNCNYCPFRAGRDMRRATFKPEEMAKVFSEINQADLAEGIFLSSGIIGGGLKTQDGLLDTAHLLRKKHNFRGYLHLKLMPGCDQAQVERAMALATRVSINLEAPNPARLGVLAPKKKFDEELLRPLLWAQQIRKSQPWHIWASTVTQFVVGAAGETDLELLSLTERLHQQAGLSRAYFSAFSPIKDTPLENHTPENPWREHRLYQSSFLLRDYGFELEELPFTEKGNLPLHEDPKMAWAKMNLAHAPVELNHADKRDLLRVPGIGPKGVTAILDARKTGSLRNLRDLKSLGVLAARAAPFILLAGKRPIPQMALF